MSESPSEPQSEPTRIPTWTLNDGLVVPQVGFGTYPLRGEEGITAMVSALEQGYRLIDSAVNYENEEEVGEALRRSGLDREHVLVTTKVPGRFHEKSLAIASVEDSLRRLRLDVIDLVLIHWPNPSQHLYVDAWQGLVDCRERGLVRSIGVSNFTPRHLDDIIAATGVTPSVNQIEMHPAFPQVELRAVHERLGIRTEAWSPLARMEGEAAAPIADAAAAHGVTPAQVVLRWHVQLGSLALPKSADPRRQRLNLDIFDFTLTDDEVSAITALCRPDGRLFDADPETHEEM